MKKFTILAISLGLLIACTSGCGKKDEAATGDTTDPAMSPSTPKTDKPSPETTTGGSPQGGAVEVKSATDPGPG